MTNIFFTADAHFNHKKCQELFRNRCFASLEEMNETIIENWNAKIGKNDLVYHLGDVELGSSTGARTILDRLNGQIYLVRGNHENVAEHKLCRNRFIWIKDYHRLKIGDQKIYMCHYSFRVWNCMHHGSWNLYGHSRGSLYDDPGLKSCDVGVDCWDFSPVSYEQLEQKMATKHFITVDHHAEGFEE